MKEHTAMSGIEVLRPGSADELHRFVHVILGMRVPRQAVVAGNHAPFDYLEASYFEGKSGEEDADGCDTKQSGDLVVWANRGGGKTCLAAAATLLDLLFKPGIQVRILGGSFEQSSKMYRYLLRMLDRPALKGVVKGRPTQRRVELVNGSVVEVLSQSSRSVRGQRVHKLRCDEVEMFDPEVWEAAKFVTQSGRCGDVRVRGTVEAMSTMHRPYGLMSRLVPETVSGDGEAAAGSGARLFRWCALDVAERCPPQRECDKCVLWDDCRGRAKEADGFVSIDDLVTQWKRASHEAWGSEMMCKRPRRSSSVYPGFDPEVGGKHVVKFSTEKPAEESAKPVVEQGVLVGGMDFGLRSPLVMLWGRVYTPKPEGAQESDEACENDPTNEADGAEARPEVLEIYAEYVATDRTLEEHLKEFEKYDGGRPVWIGVDPAGLQRNSQTGRTDIEVLRERGYRVRWQQSTVRDGIERVRRRLDRGTLRIRSDCEQLIEAMTMYHFSPVRVASENPVKDGPDHLCDALRYLIANLERGDEEVEERRY